MKKIIQPLLYTTLCTLLISCSAFQGKNPEESAPKMESFTSASQKLKISAPSGWALNTQKNPYDVQVLSAEKDLASGFFIYAPSDFKEKVTGLQLLGIQIKDFERKREKFAAVEGLRIEKYEDKTVTSGVYSGIKNGKQNYYKFSLIEFKSQPEMMVISLQVGTPEGWTLQRRVLEDILISAELLAPVADSKLTAPAASTASAAPASSPSTTAVPEPNVTAPASAPATQTGSATAPEVAPVAPAAQ